ncbi:MAG: hypothetical protein HOM82_03990 [Thaumarchaeota archaeon]|nr:hypothetical protein [Nitrososphaerota archaeon]MBT4176176.1 hypothetical protein [Nitrososphaerota archaeon]MBT4510486.1 hypothetical protein [Nitrososphaerota archaeon]MBT4676195.1 hypothetical protein [Nitrososphaerota archaeon]MBT4973391.1 hypothetical protein [Nitrososphaerota archaeon]
MKTKISIFAGLIILVAMIGMSPSFADSNTIVLSTTEGVQLTQTVVSMSISSDNVMPWGFIEGTIENHAEGFPVILQIYQNDEPVHFAQTTVNEDGTYEYKFRARNVDGNNVVNVYEGDYEVKIFKSIQITGKNLI